MFSQRVYRFANLNLPGIPSTVFATPFLRSRFVCISVRADPFMLGFELYTPVGNMADATSATSISDDLVGMYGGWLLSPQTVALVGVIWATGTYWTDSPAPQGVNYVCIQNDGTASTDDPLPCVAGTSYFVTFQAAAWTGTAGNVLAVLVNGAQVELMASFFQVLGPGICYGSGLRVGKRG